MRNIDERYRGTRIRMTASRAESHRRFDRSAPGDLTTRHGGSSRRPRLLVASDSRLKEAVVPLRRLKNGIELCRFRYRGDSEIYVGVIAQQVAGLIPNAVVRGDDGYLRVDYDRLGVSLMTWTEWRLSQALPTNRVDR